MLLFLNPELILIPSCQVSYGSKGSGEKLDDATQCRRGYDTVLSVIKLPSFRRNRLPC